MKINIKALLAYFFTIGVSVLFMLFLDGPGGSYLLIALTLAFLVSFGIFFWTKKTLTVEVSISEDILNKGDIIKVGTVLRKRGIVPTCLIKFSFFSSVHFTTEDEQGYCAVLFAQDEYSAQKSFTAVFFGNGNIGIENVVLSDFFGIFSYSVVVPDLCRSVKVYPNIPDISNRDNFARSLTDAVSFDDSEETSQSMTSINGVPGYDHRKYVPGDNLKLINWKLSAKRGELLVRQLEGTGGAEQVFVLVRDDLYYEESQFAAEAMLGMAMVFAKAELPVRVIIYMGEGWEEIAVKNPPELSQLRYKMTDYHIFPLKKYCERHKLREAPELRKIAVPDSIEGDRAVIFAPVFDSNLSTLMDRLTASGTECQAAVCIGEILDKRVRKIERDNLSVRFSD